MKEYINIIIRRQYTNEKVIEILTNIIPALLPYYNNDNLVINAIRNLEIKVCPSDIPLNSFISGNIKYTLESDIVNDKINQGNGVVFSTEPLIKYKKEEDIFILKENSKRVLFIKEKCLKTDKAYELILRELICSIKSVNKNSYVSNGKLIKRNGLLQIFYELQYIEGIVYTKLITESGRNINNILTTIDMENIFEYLGKEFSYSNKLEVYLLKKVLANPSAYYLFKTVTLDGDIIKLRDSFDYNFYEGALDRLIKTIDDIKSFDYANNEVAYQICKNKIEDYLNDLNRDKIYERKAA